MAGELSDHLLALVNEADVVAIGPGLDDIDETLKLLRGVVGAVGEHAGIVLDAYALGALSGQTDLLGSLASRAVLTPNLSEARRLLDHDLTDDLDAEAIEVAQRYATVVSLYGHVASPDGDVWREESADVGLGTSGSGDVSAGIVAGLMARGCEPAQAACWAAYVHSVAGLRLTTTFGRTGYLARELVDEVATTLSMV
ncbi:MAG: carbohydrate kinase, partial [Nocardioidaceae bacterium]|nr:carbohydrate kinase [Nocardioidaceae bacterium]